MNPPKNNGNEENKPTKPAETAGDVIYLKITSGTTATQLAAKKLVKKYKNLARKKPFKRTPPATYDTAKVNDEDINNLDTIAELETGKNEQIAAKKISEKYKQSRAKKRKIVLVEEHEEKVLLPKRKGEDTLKTNTYIFAKKIKDKYKK